MHSLGLQICQREAISSANDILHPPKFCKRNGTSYQDLFKQCAILFICQNICQWLRLAAQLAELKPPKSITDES